MNRSEEEVVKGNFNSEGKRQEEKEKVRRHELFLFFFFFEKNISTCIYLHIYFKKPKIFFEKCGVLGGNLRGRCGRTLLLKIGMQRSESAKIE
jgi:hypothetical protein